MRRDRDPHVLVVDDEPTLARAGHRPARGRVAGRPDRLTPTAWAILDLLARNLGRLVSREDILRAVWGSGYERQTHYLRVYIAQLRRKIEDDPAHPTHLLTSSGLGYLLEPDAGG